MPEDDCSFLCTYLRAVAAACLQKTKYCTRSTKDCCGTAVTSLYPTEVELFMLYTCQAIYSRPKGPNRHRPKTTSNDVVTCRSSKQAKTHRSQLHRHRSDNADYL